MGIRIMLLSTPATSFEGLAAWKEVVCERFVPLEVQASSKNEFINLAATEKMGGLAITELRASAQRVRRTAVLARRAEHPLYKVTLQFSGCSSIVQGKRQAVLQAGQWGIYDTTQPYEVAVADQAHFLVLQLPGERMSAWQSSLDDALARAFPTESGPARIAVDMLRLGLQERGRLPSAALADLSETVIRMMGLSLSQGRQATSDSALEEVRRGQLLQIQQYILENLADPDLTAQSLAVQFRISRRYLYKLFERHGQAPADYILGMRLDRARQLLAEAGPGARISELAWRLGFSDAAVFSHAFRRRFGVSPTEWRRTHG